MVLQKYGGYDRARDQASMLLLAGTIFSQRVLNLEIIPHPHSPLDLLNL